jgi:hypothetical protein
MLLDRPPTTNERIEANPFLLLQLTPEDDFPRAGVIGRFLAVAAFLTAWAPVVGLGVAVLAIVVNRGVGDWQRTASWIAAAITASWTATVFIVAYFGLI